MGPRRSETRHAHLSRPVAISFQDAQCTWRFGVLGAEHAAEGRPWLEHQSINTLYVIFFPPTTFSKHQASIPSFHFSLLRYRLLFSPLLFASHIVSYRIVSYRGFLHPPPGAYPTNSKAAHQAQINEPTGFRRSNPAPFPHSHS